MYPAAESEAKMVYKEPIFVDEHKFFINVFIQKASIEENTASECIRNVAATYGCKILQLYEYEANKYSLFSNVTCSSVSLLH